MRITWKLEPLHGLQTRPSMLCIACACSSYHFGPAKLSKTAWQALAAALDEDQYFADIERSCEEARVEKERLVRAGLVVFSGSLQHRSGEACKPTTTT